MLQFVYTDNCDLLSIGANFKLNNAGHNSPARHDDIFHMEMADEDTNGGYVDGKKSAYNVTQEQKKGGKGKSEKLQQTQNEKNPLKLLLDVARKWGVKGLVKR